MPFDVLDFPNVTYRASGAGGKDVELHLALDPASATIQDAWIRLSTAFDAVDPTNLEILIREVGDRFDLPPPGE